MKRTVKPNRGGASPNTKASSVTPAKIHPVITYPFGPTGHYGDLEALYGLVGRLSGEPQKYARPITVMDRKTYYSQRKAAPFHAFRDRTIARCGDMLDTWGVDTCQMWYTGLGAAFERGRAGDVYWLIPGDFNYGTTVGHEVLSRLHDLPEIILDLNQDLCIGEIETDFNNPKHLIDTYGTFALLYNWFPAEAREIRQYTERPRSEFFAVRHEFLADVLTQRWYPYEQTVVMLLRAIFTQKQISRFFVGNISDLPEGRESLSSAWQQVERTERVLKNLWREHHGSSPKWVERYRDLEQQSELIRRTALTILQNLLPVN
jgi:hypothetical protein